MSAQDGLPEWAKNTLRPSCPACGGYLLPCTETATGVHPRTEAEAMALGWEVELDRPAYGVREIATPDGYGVVEDTRPTPGHGTYHEDQALCPATGDEHVWTDDVGPQHEHLSARDRVHCDECGASPPPGFFDRDI